MQVWTRLAVGFATTALAIAGLYGTYQLRQEAIDLRAANDRELRLLGAGLATAAADAFRDTQTTDLREIADRMKVGDPSTDVLVFEQVAVVAGLALGTALCLALAARLLPADR